MLTYQACENVLVSRLKVAGKIVGAIFVAAVIGAAVVHVIIPGFMLICRGAEPVADRGFASAEERAEYYRLLRYHGLLSDVAMVEEDPDGSLWFNRDDQRCRLQWPEGR